MEIVAFNPKILWSIDMLFNLHTHIHVTFMICLEQK